MAGFRHPGGRLTRSPRRGWGGGGGGGGCWGGTGGAWGGGLFAGAGGLTRVKTLSGIMTLSGINRFYAT